MFGNRILKKTFGSQRGEVAIYWRQLRNEEFPELHLSQYEYFPGGEVGGTRGTCRWRSEMHTEFCVET